ncbi:MAG: hypothetical protein NUW37_06350 [Planctomycetes bacterium]|nr:hypothetical protein [Planctomycetota bacterium]
MKSFAPILFLIVLSAAFFALWPDPAEDETRPGEVQIEIIGGEGHGWGQFHRPRAICASPDGSFFVIDQSGRIQKFTPEGKFDKGVHLPDSEKGTPTGMMVDREGNLVVCDTHYYRVLVFDHNLKLVKTFDESRYRDVAPMKFVTECEWLLDEDGNQRYYFLQYGEEKIDTVLALSPEGEHIDHFGGFGSSPGNYLRPMGMTKDADGNLVVADSVNHRIQKIDPAGNVLAVFGGPGRLGGELNYPYDVDVDSNGTLYVVEFGNHRLSRFTSSGRFLGVYGGFGSEPGKFHGPWGVCAMPDDSVLVTDTDNHRIVRLKFPRR